MAIAYAAGTAYVAPRAISAQAIRAVLLASATATTVALLADPDLAFGPATAVGLRRQSQPGRELATGPKQRRVGHTCGRRQPPARLVGPMPLEDFRLGTTYIVPWTGRVGQLISGCSDIAPGATAKAFFRKAIKS